MTPYAALPTPSSATFRSLDAEIASKVFNRRVDPAWLCWRDFDTNELVPCHIEVCRRSPAHDHETVEPVILNDRAESYDASVHDAVAVVPKYSTRFADAWLIAKQYESAGWTVMLRNNVPGMRKWCAVFIPPEGKPTLTADSDTEAMALCLVGLKAPAFDTTA